MLLVRINFVLKFTLKNNRLFFYINNIIYYFIILISKNQKVLFFYSINIIIYLKSLKYYFKDYSIKNNIKKKEYIIKYILFKNERYI